MEQAQLKISPKLAEDIKNGNVTLAQVAGLDTRKLYEIANVGFKMLSSGKLQEAKTIYSGLVAASPDDSVFHCHLGATHHRLGEFDAAYGEYEKALSLNAENVDALVGRGELKYMRGGYEEAVNDLRRAFELDPMGKRPSTQRARTLIWSLKEALEKQEKAANEANEPPPAATEGT
jgi:tetratricopeptide (TPR) repeat protein